jgi:prepilin signal peptidase PulO-like enzyme (type II secretory pathway)
MAALFTGIILLAPDHPRTLVWFAFLSILALITIIDLEHRLVLYIVILPALLITVLLNGLFPERLPDGTERGLGEYLLGAVLGAGVFFLMFLGGGVFGDIVAALRGRSLNEVPFGFGDVLLAGLCGLMIGWRAMVFAMFITVFVGALGAIIYMGMRLWQSGRYTLYTALPYGPYIVFGTVVMMLLIEPIRAWVR